MVLLPPHGTTFVLDESVVVVDVHLLVGDAACLSAPLPLGVCGDGGWLQEVRLVLSLRHRGCRHSLLLHFPLFATVNNTRSTTRNCVGKLTENGSKKLARTNGQNFHTDGRPDRFVAFVSVLEKVSQKVRRQANPGAHVYDQSFLILLLEYFSPKFIHNNRPRLSASFVEKNLSQFFYSSAVFFHSTVECTNINKAFSIMCQYFSFFPIL